MHKDGFNLEEVKEAADKAGINFSQEGFDVETLMQGMKVELEHGRIDNSTNVTDDDFVTTAKIAWAHLRENPKYYTYLAKMEAEMDAEESAQ